MSQTTIARVIVKSGRVQPIWFGHPWVYTGSIERIEGQPQAGDLVELQDPKRQCLGYGLFHPTSQIQVRMLSAANESWAPTSFLRPDLALADLVRQRLLQATQIRMRLRLPSQDTDAFRWVHSEGDRLPGLTIDWYQRVAVIQFTTFGMKRLEQVVVDALLSMPEPFRPSTIVEVAAPRFARLEGFDAQTRVLHADPLFRADDKIICKESGVFFEVSPLDGQKTGLFLDQRDNRLTFAAFCQGLDVLDVCSYTGGFALQALRHGANKVTCVDSSEKALAQLKNNAQRNQWTAVECIQSDAFDFLEKLPAMSQDILVVDPPKFAHATKDIPAALKAYRRLNAAAMKAIKPGGILATCSCSQRIDPLSFQRMIAAAAVDAQRSVRLLVLDRQAADHPILPGFPEGDYLKFAVLFVE